MAAQPLEELASQAAYAYVIYVVWGRHLIREAASCPSYGRPRSNRSWSCHPISVTPQVTCPETGQAFLKPVNFCLVLVFKFTRVVLFDVFSQNILSDCLCNLQTLSVWDLQSSSSHKTILFFILTFLLVNIGKLVVIKKPQGEFYTATMCIFNLEMLQDYKSRKWIITFSWK